MAIFIKVTPLMLNLTCSLNTSTWDKASGYETAMGIIKAIGIVCEKRRTLIREHKLSHYSRYSTDALGTVALFALYKRC